MCAMAGAHVESTGGADVVVGPKEREKERGKGRWFFKDKAEYVLLWFFSWRGFIISSVLNARRMCY